MSSGNRARLAATVIYTIAFVGATANDRLAGMATVSETIYLIFHGLTIYL
jgi:hypothetical protein